LVSLTADLSLDQDATTPHIEVCEDGLLAVSLGNELVEIRLIATLPVLMQLVANIHTGLMDYCPRRPAGPAQS
jgi:hypothetical protein